MNITYVKGDATLPVGEGNRVIVHCCNDVGAWGAGFVLALSERYPSVEEAYRRWADGTVNTVNMPFQLGEVQFVVPKEIPEESGIVVANLIGQHGIGRDERGVAPIRYPAIMRGLKTVREYCFNNKASVHMPRMGCGLAGGNWKEIERIILQTLCSYSVYVTVYDLG